jgi:hypothetical protein
MNMESLPLKNRSLLLQCLLALIFIVKVEGALLPAEYYADFALRSSVELVLPECPDWNAAFSHADCIAQSITPACTNSLMRISLHAIIALNTQLHTRILALGTTPPPSSSIVTFLRTCCTPHSDDTPLIQA